MLHNTQSHSYCMLHRILGYFTFCCRVVTFPSGLLHTFYFFINIKKIKLIFDAILVACFLTSAVIYYKTRCQYNTTSNQPIDGT